MPNAPRLDRTLLEGNKLFAGVPPALLDALTSIPEYTADTGDAVIFREGDAADAFFLIASGAVRISKRGRGGRQENLTVFAPGDFFGEMALYDPAPRSAQATTTQPTVLGRVDQEGFRRMLELAPIEISANLTRETIRRLRQVDALLIHELLQAERMSLIGSMAGTIIHDFRNPMSVIVGAAELMAEESTDPDLTRYVGMIRRSVDRMLTMAQELLDFSRGVSSLELRSITVPELLDELDEQALHLLSGAGLRVEVNVAYSGTLIVDRNRFVRLLLNLIRNAAEAMAPGGLLRLEITSGDGMAHFSISDTGCGIPQEILERIFEPFVTHGKAEGTGLGMAIAKSVADAHHGHIRISSTPGVGTTCVVSIPLDPPSPGAGPASPAAGG